MVNVIILREAEFPKDSGPLLEWRNDPITRANSVNTAPVERVEHEEWLKASIDSPEKKIFIAELMGGPVGSVRIESRGNHSELSWTVAPGSRGKGIGKIMVSAALRLLSGEVTAKIRSSNAASIKIASSSGFVKEREEGGFTYWRLSNI